MKAIVHVYSSAALGGVVYIVTSSQVASVSAFLSGILIDIDHIFDFLIFSREKFSVRNFFSWCDDGRWEKISMPFHSYELYLLLVITTYYFPNNMLLGFLFGLGLHLVLDQIWNCHLRKELRLFKYFYFLSYRFYTGFHKSKLQVGK